MSSRLFPRYKQLLRRAVRRSAAHRRQHRQAGELLVAARAMAFADGRTAIRAWFEFFAQASVPSSTSAAKPYTVSCAIIRWSPCEAVGAFARRGQVIQTWCRWAGQSLDRAVTAISPLTRSLERAATLFRTRPLPCHHPLTGNWDGSLISARPHWLISSRTTEANASRFSRANRQTMGASARRQWRYGNYRIHLVRGLTFGNGWQ